MAVKCIETTIYVEELPKNRSYMKFEHLPVSETFRHAAVEHELIGISRASYQELVLLAYQICMVTS
jgi:hypothetical protein